MVDPRTDPIELTRSRHAEWRRRFLDERNRIRRTLDARDLEGRLRRIDHVGSTAVPGLAAKDIVDVGVVVADDAVTAVSRAIADALGGTRVENSDGWHPVFRRSDGQRFNDHVFAGSSDGWKVSVVTREVLRARPDLRDTYEELKRDLAAEYEDLESYSRGKTDLIERLLREARTAEDLEFAFPVPSEP